MIKQVTFTLGILFCCFNAMADKVVSNAKISYVYQPDIAATEFEFLSDVANSCGSYLYRVVSTDPSIADRKFSMILAAFMADKNIAFNDTEVCSGSRSKVSWIRLTR